ncbi:MAG: chemotaxis protein CheB [Rhodocyclales bacterium]|nr:chemotaxis protein CheB [Rhodocyclales bacterium]
MKYGIVVIGASLGGLQAVHKVLAGLPGDFPLPLAVAQHRRQEGGDSLLFVLQDSCALSVREGEDKLPIMPGCVYLAPSGYHLLVDGDHFALSTESPVSYAQPSIDVLFESAADTFGRRAIGVVLTGSGRDGAAGLAAIKQRGGVALVESAETALAAEMPDAARAATPGAKSLRIEAIPLCLLELSRK